MAIIEETLTSVYTRYCKTCSKEFTTSSKNKVFCTAKCTNKYRYIHDKDKQAMSDVHDKAMMDKWLLSNSVVDYTSGDALKANGFKE